MQQVHPGGEIEVERYEFFYKKKILFHIMGIHHCILCNWGRFTKLRQSHQNSSMLENFLQALLLNLSSGCTPGTYYLTGYNRGCWYEYYLEL